MQLNVSLQRTSQLVARSLPASRPAGISSVIFLTGLPMKTYFIAAIIAIFSLQACTSGGVARPVIEQGIYHPTPPSVEIKQRIYVRERERPLLPRINDASDSIVQFLLDMHLPKKTAAADVRHVLDGSRSILRLPPPATLQGRYVGMMVYCWESESEDQLKFLVEWADVTTMARYTDSYVFVQRGSSWYFEKHGGVTPWHWTKVEPYFQRNCPTNHPTAS